MLSFIYNLVSSFETSHGIRPNLLYLNSTHIQHLLDGFDDQYDLPAVMNMLDMEIIVDKGVIHPHVAWTRIMDNKAMVC